MPEIAGIGVLSAFLAGMVSFLSPCVLPLVPGYLSYVAGRSVDELSDGVAMRARLRTVGLSLSFSSGFSAVFIALGASATALGQLFQAYRSEADLIAGSIVALLGLHLIGVFRFGWLNRDWRYTGQLSGGTPAGAFVLGSAFAFGWTPCIGPILGAILTMSAATLSVGGGIALLSVYSLGLAVPFVLAATFTGFFLARMCSYRRLGRPLQIAAGSILVLMGIAMMTGTLASFGTWLLNTFPFFQSVVI
jgi:cytochrome c-type biogenesis protein